MTDRWKRLTLKAILAGALSVVLLSPAANAGLSDPVPIFRNTIESPPERSLYSGKMTQFFCPLSKKFYEQVGEIEIQTILLEALGEGFRGMVAVGEVIRNRSGLFLKDHDAVCLMPKQFSCWNDEARAKRFLEEYRDYYFVAAMAWIESKRTVLTGGATDYHAELIHPYWADSYRVAAHIGKHIFYVRK